jgi:beta-galactosidase
MIYQNHNHPSVCFLGLQDTSGGNPTQHLKERAATLNSSRLTTVASGIGNSINETTDLIAWNVYYGWDGGKPSDVGAWADETHSAYPATPVGVSEYGAGANIYHQQDSLKQPNPSGYWHPENRQTSFHEQYWRELDRRSFLWGTFIWNMFDFGDDKGLVTFDRKVRKDAFHFYKANWNATDMFVYIAERRHNKRSGRLQTIKVYSNCPAVELFINGKSMGKRKGDYGTFTWKVTLQPNDNTVIARAASVAADNVIINILQN